MTIVRHEITQIIKNGKKINRLGHILFIRCDNCGLEKQVAFRQKMFSNQFHYCSRKCFIASDSGKRAAVTRRNNTIEKYGVINISQLQEIKDKKAETLFVNYGARSVLQSEILTSKIKATNIERYGVENPMNNPLIVNKLKTVMMEKYGVENTSQLEDTKDKKIKTSIKNYGVEYPMLSDIVKSKINFKENCVKAQKTKKNNGTSSSSKIEDMLYMELCFIFGESNIERHAIVNNWNIDFYIKSFNIYLQLDGVYWHGLDGDIDLIRLKPGPQAKNIARKYDVDLEQIKWFNDNNLILVRVTDKEYNNHLKVFKAEMLSLLK